MSASKTKATVGSGMRSFDHRLPATVSETDLLTLVGRLNRDPVVHGILVQMPLPPHIDSNKVIEAIDPNKDVDGLHPVNFGRLAAGLPALASCTPLGCLILAKSVHPSLEGLEAVVIGRSGLVGRPLAQLVLNENATLTIAHSKTRDLPEVCRRADLMFAAVGRPEFVRKDWIKPGATVIDVGITRVRAGRERQVAAGRRCRIRRSIRGRGRDHAGAGRRRPDDDRVPARQHRACGLHAGRPAAAGLQPAELGRAIAGLILLIVRVVPALMAGHPACVSNQGRSRPRIPETRRGAMRADRRTAWLDYSLPLPFQA